MFPASQQSGEIDKFTQLQEEITFILTGEKLTEFRSRFDELLAECMDRKKTKDRQWRKGSLKTLFFMKTSQVAKKN